MPRHEPDRPDPGQDKTTEEKISPQAWWTLVAVSLGTFMLLLDITIVVVALPDIQKALGAGFSDVQWTVDAYSLSLASLLLAVGLGRRPLRPPRRLRRRARHLHRRLAALRARPVARDADRLPRPPGHRRGDDLRHLARAARPDLPRQSPRHRLRRLGRGRLAQHRARPAARRPAHHRHRLALDLLRQRADRHPRRGRHPPLRRGVEDRRRRGASTSPASRSSPSACSPSSTG